MVRLVSVEVVDGQAVAFAEAIRDGRLTRVRSAANPESSREQMRVYLARTGLISRLGMRRDPP